MKELKHWRDLTPQQRDELMIEHNIKVVTFDWICKIFDLSNENNK